MVFQLFRRPRTPTHPTRPSNPQLGLNFNVRVRRHLAPTSYSRCWISHPGDASMDSSRPCPRQDPRDPKMNLGGQGGMANREKSVQVWSLQGSKEKFEKKQEPEWDDWQARPPIVDASAKPRDIEMFGKFCPAPCPAQSLGPEASAIATTSWPSNPRNPLKVDMGTLLKWQEWLQNHLRSSSHHELAISHGGLAGLGQ